MSDAIIALDIVMSNGEMCHISTVENAELLDGARVSLGTLGVIYSVTVQCERQFNLHLEEDLLDLDEVMIAIDETVTLTLTLTLIGLIGLIGLG